ncbi:unnamed protein product [Linum tenue]|uniref:Uncharacterized protein n=1 Tax=Linum tenue TaxID=586396 RepID=A0AAV0IQR4_9ROSI|nr:unnamed protein product [Linum tenue]
MAGTAGEIMLFGVRVVVDSMRKSVSLNNLSQYEQPSALVQANDGGVGVDNKEGEKDTHNDVKEDAVVAAGYGSADDAVHHSSSVSRSERKRGVPWTEEEHKLFLIGLQKVGKGDWRGISRNFVKTRTPTQVASHAQKYFLRRLNINRRRRRSSLFDITTDTVAGISMGGEEQQQENKKKRTTTTSHSSNFPVMSNFTISTTNSAAVLNTTQIPVVDNLSLGGGQGNNQCISASNLIRPPALVHQSSLSRTISDVDLNLNSSPAAAAADPLPLSLNLSLHSNETTTARRPGFQMMSSLSGDSSISVA